MVDDVVCNGQAGDIEQHHARETVAGDVLDLVVADGPVVAANAAARSQAQANGAVGRVLDQVVLDDEVVIGVRCRLAFDGRGAAIESQAIDRDVV